MIEAISKICIVPIIFAILVTIVRYTGYWLGGQGFLGLVVGIILCASLFILAFFMWITDS